MHEQTEQLESRPLVDYDHTSTNSEDDNEEVYECYIFLYYPFPLTL